MTYDCSLCDGACTGADLGPLLTLELRWLWDALATAADRRGDPHLTSGPQITVTTPAPPAHRSAVAGLLERRELKPGARITIDLARLSQALTVRGSHLTPGAVAAHATGRRLATKADDAQRRAAAIEALRHQLDSGIAALPAHVRGRIEPETAFDRLRGIAWVPRILDHSTPEDLLDTALAVAALLPPPGQRVDRRTLVPGHPHALDAGTLPSLVLALTNAAPGPARTAWSSLGVDCDNLLGGLIVTGIAPRGWYLPTGAAATIPPRELDAVHWQPPPTPGTWAFLTENPSVLAAALDYSVHTRVPIRLVCTAGTPSSVENNAVARLHHVGWRVAVRADFDPAGLAHVRAILTAAPHAVPWRMTTADYLQSGPVGELGRTLTDDDAPWDPSLIATMRERNAPAFEEALLPLLLSDIVRGNPEKGIRPTHGSAAR